jgi:hypothetical protein
MVCTVGESYEATTCFHDGVPYPVLQKTDLVRHDPGAFHPTTGVFQPDADGGNSTMCCFLRGREFSSRRFSLGLDDRDVLQAESLQALLVIQTAARWQALPSQLGQALLRGCACIGVAPEAHVTGLVAHQAGFERVTRLLAPVICLWLFGIGRAVDRPGGAIMPNRGVVEPPAVACVSNIAATSAAVRAGSRSWAARACFNPGCST